MKMLIIMGCIFLFLFCAPKKTAVKTEGLEEIIVFEEEEGVVTEEPVYPTPTPTTPPTEITTPPVIEEVTLPPEETVKPPPAEEVAVVPPPIEEPEVIPQPSLPAPTPTVSEKPMTVHGFRVQLFASSTQKGANRVAEDARSLFGSKVYIEHAPPYYRVRIGDCLTKEEAERLKRFAVSKGYKGAFIVETMITP